MKYILGSLSVSVFIIIIYFVFNIRISVDSMVEGINALIMLQSIILGIYSISLSIIAALHDTKLIRRLLRPKSTSREEIQNINSSAFIANIASLVLLILFLFTYEIVITNTTLIFIMQLLIPFCVTLSLLYIYEFFKIINATLFQHSEHEWIYKLYILR